MGRHSHPEPGQPGWTHKDVRGETDPAEIKRRLEEIERREQQERERIRKGQ